MSENEEKVEKGGISVQTEQIFPVIKKWLYSDKDIFVREIVSNACDACTKLRRLISLGEVQGIENDFRITVALDKEEKTIRFDIVVSFDAKDRSQVYREVCENVQNEYPDYSLQIAMDIDFSEIEKNETEKP